MLIVESLSAIHLTADRSGTAGDEWRLKGNSIGGQGDRTYFHKSNRHSTIFQISQRYPRNLSAFNEKQGHFLN
jgi:hypothetical protein